MAIDAASIGANFSDYQGNAGLASGNFGVIGVDTKPLEQLAAYTMLSNQMKWNQRQAETDAKVAQLADLSNISLNELRGKDKEQLTKDFTGLIQKFSDYARKVPKNEQERIQNELDIQTAKGAFINNFNSGKGRAVSYYAHRNTIMQKVPDATTQDEAIKQLNKSFDSTDIGTPISAVPNFKLEKFEIPTPVTQKINTIAILPNNNIDIEGAIFNPKQNVPLADAAILNLNQTNIKKGTPEYNALSDNEKAQADFQATVSSQGKGWIDAVTPLNQALQNPAYIKADGTFDSQKFEDENSANTVVINPYNALKNMNSSMHSRYDEALNGVFNDKGVQIKLPQGVGADDFKAGFIDFSKGVTPTQLVLSGMYAKHSGDVFNKKVTHTGDDNEILKEKMRDANAIKLKNIDERGANYRAALDLIGKGYVRDAKGKWQAPAKNAPSGTTGGIIPYWQNYILPQIDKGYIKITTDKGGFLGKGTHKEESNIPNDFTGDVDIPSDKLSGLSVALSGELTDEGKQVPYNKSSETKIRYADGQPVGIVIDGVFYDPNDINSKATRLQDKNVNNKFDTPVFDNTPNTIVPSTEPAKTTSKGLPVFK